MKFSHKIWIGLLLEIVVAVVVHWFLLERAREFSGVRAWWDGLRRATRYKKRGGFPASSAEVHRRALPEMM